MLVVTPNPGTVVLIVYSGPGPAPQWHRWPLDTGPCSWSTSLTNQWWNNNFSSPQYCWYTKLGSNVDVGIKLWMRQIIRIVYRHNFAHQNLFYQKELFRNRTDPPLMNIDWWAVEEMKKEIIVRSSYCYSAVVSEAGGWAQRSCALCECWINEPLLGNWKEIDIVILW